MERIYRDPTKRQAVQTLEDQGWNLRSRGLPDFLGTRDGKLRMFYIKPKGRPVRRKEQEVINLLLRAGVMVEVVRTPEME